MVGSVGCELALLPPPPFSPPPSPRTDLGHKDSRIVLPRLRNHHPQQDLITQAANLSETKGREGEGVSSWSTDRARPNDCRGQTRMGPRKTRGWALYWARIGSPVGGGLSMADISTLTGSEVGCEV